MTFVQSGISVFPNMRVKLLREHKDLRSSTLNLTVNPHCCNTPVTVLALQMVAQYSYCSPDDSPIDTIHQPRNVVSYELF